MAGSDQSARLQGMLTQLASDVGEMGAGRNFGANAIRQLARPDNQARFRGQEFGLDNSANLMQMAQWAERNDFDDKSRQYMAMADRYQQREIEESKRQRLSAAQLQTAKALTEMQSIARDTSRPSKERIQAINNLSLQAQQQLSAGGGNPITVIEPANRLITYITDLDVKNSASTIQTEAQSLSGQISQAQADGDAVASERLISQFSGVVARANAHGDPDLVAEVGELYREAGKGQKDAREIQQDSRAARAFELWKQDPTNRGIIQLTGDPVTKEKFDKKVADFEATQTAAQKAELDIAKAEREAAEADRRARELAEEAVILPREAVKYLTEEEWANYKQQHANSAELPERQKNLNKTYRDMSKSNEAEIRSGAGAAAMQYVMEVPNRIAALDDDKGEVFGNDLEDWAEMLETNPTLMSNYKTHAEIVAKNLTNNLEFIDADPERRRQMAFEKTLEHLMLVDSEFRKNFEENAVEIEAAQRRTSVKLQEEEAGWKWTRDPESGVVMNADPEHPNGLFKKLFELSNKGRVARGENPRSESEFRKEWTEKYKRPLVNEKDAVDANANSRTNPDPDPSYARRTGLVRPRQQGRKARTVPTSNQPSLLQRQRDNLSPPIGPMGDAESYQTKLKQARDAQPYNPYAGSLLTDFPDTAPPYIDPRYRNFGG